MNWKNYTCLHIVPARREAARCVVVTRTRRPLVDLLRYFDDLLFRRIK